MVIEKEIDDSYNSMNGYFLFTLPHRETKEYIIKGWESEFLQGNFFIAIKYGS